MKTPTCIPSRYILHDDSNMNEKAIRTNQNWTKQNNSISESDNKEDQVFVTLKYTTI